MQSTAMVAAVIVVVVAVVVLMHSDSIEFICTIQKTLMYVCMLAQLAACIAQSQSCCQTLCCPTIYGTGLTNPKMPVFYKFWPLKQSINLGPFGKSVVQLYLYYFYSFMFTLVTHRLCTTLSVLYFHSRA